MRSTVCQCTSTPSSISSENDAPFFCSPLVSDARSSCAIKWKPTYSEAHFTRGLALLALGRKEEANLDFKEALELSRDSSVWLYCHMYASSGSPTHEGFAPRQRAPNSLEWLEQESAEVEAISEAQTREEQERLAWMGAFIEGRAGPMPALVGEDDDSGDGFGSEEDGDEEEEGDGAAVGHEEQ